MHLRLAVANIAALALLSGCGEAVDRPQPADPSERQVLAEAAEMLPADGKAPSRLSGAPADAERSAAD